MLVDVLVFILDRVDQLVLQVKISDVVWHLIMSCVRWYSSVVQNSPVCC